MPETVNRQEWGARPPKAGPGDLDPAKVVGLALHWPGLTKPISGVRTVSAAIRGWQNFHIDGRGWSDIAYQMAYDQDGNTYILRGMRTQSGANGDQDVNEKYGAFLLVLAPGEEPSDAMVAAVRRGVAEHRALFPKSKKIVGHRDIRPEPTDCPGDDVEDAIHDDLFEPPSAPTRVARARKRIRRAVQLLEDTRPVRVGAHQAADDLRAILHRLPKE